MSISRTTTKIAALLAILSIAGFFIYQGFAGPMKINTPESPNRLTSGLVGYWTFDGQDTNWGTNTTNDRSGNGYNGTMTNMSTTTSPAPGIVGQALNFDGVNDYIDLPSILNPSTTNFTASLWFKLNILASAQGAANYIILQQEDGTGTGRAWIFVDYTDDVLKNYFGGSSQSSGITPVANRWYHAVITWNGSTLQWYVDGVAKNSLSPTVESASGGHLIGTSKYMNAWHNGLIDEVRVYNRALSASEIAELYQQGQTKINASQANKLTNGLVLMQSFDGPHMDWSQTTAEARDQSGNSYHCNVTGDTAPGAGKIGQALIFDGSSDKVACPSSIETQIATSDFSVSLWVKPTSDINPARRLIESGTSGSVRGMAITKRASGGVYRLWLRIFDGTNVADTPSDGASLLSGEWYHIVGVFDRGGNMTRYINGSQSGAATDISGVTGSIYHGEGFFIGSSWDGSSSLEGLIDEVRVYNRALSASEITELYNQGAKRLLKANMPDTSRLTSGLVGYWTMDGQDTNWNTNITNDKSGQGNNGTMTNMSTTTSPAIGKIGQALNFDGTDDSVSVSTSLSLNTTPPLSISAWINPRSAGGNNAGRIGARTGGDGFWIFNLNSASRNLRFISSCSSGTVSRITLNTIPTNSWTHISATWDGSSTGSNIRIYINGAEASYGSTGNCTGAENSSGGNFGIGSSNGTSTFDGLIDEVRVYNRALSDAEIQELYNMGR